jgi:signal transduction histidine kinase
VETDLAVADWLLLLSREGTILAVDGGAPSAWLSRRVDDCAGMPEGVRAAARQLLRDLSQRPSTAILRMLRAAPEHPGAPSFSLIAVEAIPIRPTEVALGPLLRHALEPLIEQAAAESVSLRLELADDLPAAVSVDADKIVWAVTTLAGNALRYVRRGDAALQGSKVRVLLGYGAAQQMVNVTVQDDGPGIPADVRPWLLEPNPETGRAAGVALRLVHDIVAAHGGGTVIKSSTEATGHGTTVTLWLPIRG